jgi:hypothetical protein
MGVDNIDIKSSLNAFLFLFSSFVASFSAFAKLIPLAIILFEFFSIKLLFVPLDTTIYSRLKLL